ncbi:MAG TPA: hypothetical protein VIU33_04650 [Nitrospiria bacterium]
MSGLIADVMIITTFSLTAFMVLLVVFRVDRDVIGNRGVWIALIAVCLLMVLRTLGYLISGWVHALQPLLGLLVAFIFPWALWKFYRKTGAGLEEKKG